jgi:hypothetical protein
MGGGGGSGDGGGGGGDGIGFQSTEPQQIGEDPNSKAAAQFTEDVIILEVGVILLALESLDSKDYKI